MPKTSAQLDHEIAQVLQSKSWGKIDLDTIEKHVASRRSRDPGAWSSRDKLISIARAAAAATFASRKASPSDASIKKAREAAFNAIRRHDPLAGTADHPTAAYSHGVSELAAEGTAQAAREWVPANEKAKSRAAQIRSR
jgi:hypothetical protein